MKMTGKALWIACLALAAAGVGWAQTTSVIGTSDVFKINYFSNNAAAPVPDATVRIDNTGLYYGDLCAMIYVFNWDQQMAACCGCVETHNGLRTLSVRSNLANNPLTGQVPKTGVIKIVSAAVNNKPCDPSANVMPKANIRAWGTHIQNTAAPFYVTETEFQDSPLGFTELANLQAQCAFINILGSGQGLCTCGVGD